MNSCLLHKLSTHFGANHKFSKLPAKKGKKIIYYIFILEYITCSPVILVPLSAKSALYVCQCIYTSSPVYIPLHGYQPFKGFYIPLHGT